MKPQRRFRKRSPRRLWTRCLDLYEQLSTGSGGGGGASDCEVIECLLARVFDLTVSCNLVVGSASVSFPNFQ